MRLESLGDGGREGNWYSRRNQGKQVRDQYPNPFLSLRGGGTKQRIEGQELGMKGGQCALGQIKAFELPQPTTPLDAPFAFPPRARE